MGNHGGWILFGVCLLVLFAVAMRDDPVRICTRCHAVNKDPKTGMHGSGWVTFWLLCIGILPGLVYMAWRRSTRTPICQSCGQSTLIPIDSPAGVEISRKTTSERLPH